MGNSKKSNGNSTRHRILLPAFTLVELLVVVAIISLLAAILLPSLNKAKESARIVVCQANLRQMGIGIHMYVQDNREYLPGPSFQGVPVSAEALGATTWVTFFLKPYLGEYSDESKKGPFSCPSNSNEVLIHYLNYCYGSQMPFGYPNTHMPWKYTEIAQSAEFWAIEDADAWNYSCYSTVLPVHNGGRNVLYFDWHMEWLSTDDQPQQP